MNIIVIVTVVFYVGDLTLFFVKKRPPEMPWWWPWTPGAGYAFAAIYGIRGWPKMKPLR